MVSTYQLIGLGITIASTVLAAATYILVGLTPLTALWIGMAVVGASMALTPEEPRKPHTLATLLGQSMENAERLLEALNLGSRSIYVPRDGAVYALVMSSSAEPREVVEEARRSPAIPLVLRTPQGVAAAIRVPTPTNAAHSADLCAAISEVLIEELEMATSIQCVDEGDALALRIVEPRAPTYARLERCLGPLPLAMAAAIAVLNRGKPATIEVLERRINAVSARIVFVEV